MVDLHEGQIDEFCGKLSPDFYADSNLVRECFSHGRAANLIHYDTAFKVDLFPKQDDSFSNVEFGRRTIREFTILGEPLECAIASPEDTILRKLQ